MNALHLTPVFAEANRAAAEPVVIDDGMSSDCASHALRLRKDGSLSATPLVEGTELPAMSAEGGAVVALVHSCQRTRTWMLVVCAAEVALNGLAPPLSAAVIEPGMLLAVGNRAWFISSLWRPTPMDAPAELRDKLCPVCGGKLGLAPVVECSCGRWSHLENAAAPDDAEALNCFIAAGTCGGCGRRAALDPHVVPEVPERLAVAPPDDDDLAGQ